MFDFPFIFNRPDLRSPANRSVSIAFTHSSHPRVKIPHGSRISIPSKIFSRFQHLEAMQNVGLREDLPLSGSYANFEGYFSVEYFRVSVIDGATRAVSKSFFIYKVKRTLCIFSTRADIRDCAFYLCTGVRELSFYLLSGIISKLDQVTQSRPT